MCIFIFNIKTKREFEANADKFYTNPEVPKDAPKIDLKPKEHAPLVPHQGSLYKKNEAIFFGEKPDDRVSSRGSVFQKNAAHFYGYETPANGERPFEIPPPEPKNEAPKPVLAQRNVFY